MANVVKLKHLEHLEDEVLNYGSEGCFAIVSFLKSIRDMVGKKKSTTQISTKWDGAPSVVCGVHPTTGMFFVGTKSVFNKTEPKMCFSDTDIDEFYQGELNEKLKSCLHNFSKLGIKGVIQGDLLFTNDKKTETVNKDRLITFRPNTITYGVEENSDIGKKIKKAKIGVVFHTRYTGPDMESMAATPGVDIDSFKDVSDVAVISSKTETQKVSFTDAESKQLDAYISKINRMCEISKDFHNHLHKNSGTSGDNKWFVGSFLKPFFNAQIRDAQNITNVKQTIDRFVKFYTDKVDKEIAKSKQEKTKQKYSDIKDAGVLYIRGHQKEFQAFISLYKTVQDAKQLVIDKLDKLETFKTFVQTDTGYKVVGGEGYVLHYEGSMVKLVNRLEFSKNNFTIEKNWKK